MTSAQRVFPALLFALLTSCFTHALAAPKAELWSLWTAHDAQSNLSIDHSAWNTWLTRFVAKGEDGINRIAYDQVSAPSRDALQGYIQGLAATKISAYNRAEQFAYWVNLYNALTVDVVLENYPVKSIREIKSGFFSSGPWGLKLINVEGEDLSLDDIEHRILRPIWQDPRIHYAVNCASLGCPNLQPQAFTATNSDELLDRAAQEFINHPRGAQVQQGRLTVSSIYDWFDEDFGGNDQGVIAHLQIYAQADLKQALAGISRISGDDYDWQLNDSSGK